LGYVERKLKRPVRKPVSIVLYQNHLDFVKVARTDMIMAFAVPSRSLVVIDYSKMKEPFSLEDTLKHELAHLALNSTGRFPRWFDEGVAQWVAGGFNEFYPLKKRGMLRAALSSGRLIPFWRLSQVFPSDKNSLMLAYEESKSFIEYFIKKYGEGGLITLIQRASRGEDVENVMAEVSGLPFRELVKDWEEQLKSSYTWVHFISNNIYEILFFFGALITVAGFVLLLVKKRRYVDEDLDEEDDYDYYNKNSILDYYEKRERNDW
ncbi:MAG: hypothetical protein D6710_12295, partial [Nitrospirae bacterium]